MQIESFLLTHTYENTEEGQLVVSNHPTNTSIFDLLVFYIQTKVYKVDECYGLSSNELAKILIKSYDYKFLGIKSIRELQKKYIINKKPGSGRITEPHVTVIDIYINWEIYACIFDVIETSQYFHRDGLEDFIKIMISA